VAPRLDTGPSVVLIRWPADATVRDDLAARGVPRLLLVDAASAPPKLLLDGEDWLRVPADERDMFARIARLEARCRPPEPVDVVVDDLIVRNGSRWVAVSPLEAALVRPLVTNLGRLVTREDLADSGWDDGVARSLRSRVRGLRIRLTEIGLHLMTVRGRGYILERDDGQSA
jgi:DNA-binding response OmpR family regulator